MDLTKIRNTVSELCRGSQIFKDLIGHRARGASTIRLHVQFLNDSVLNNGRVSVKRRLFQREKTKFRSKIKKCCYRR